jgi:magnesium chelatase family protein
MEDGSVTIARPRTVTFPAGFTLAAALNPCPCGSSTTRSAVHLLATQIARYLAKISGRSSTHRLAGGGGRADDGRDRIGRPGESSRNPQARRRRARSARALPPRDVAQREMTTRHLPRVQLDVSSRKLLISRSTGSTSPRAHDRI